LHYRFRQRPAGHLAFQPAQLCQIAPQIDFDFSNGRLCLHDHARDRRQTLPPTVRDSARHLAPLQAPPLGERSLASSVSFPCKRSAVLVFDRPVSKKFFPFSNPSFLTSRERIAGFNKHARKTDLCTTTVGDEVHVSLA
jgi:hypothetical protein